MPLVIAPPSLRVEAEELDYPESIEFGIVGYPHLRKA
jgi:hypothetical protein